jgi:aminoglycoside phosphotransferase (APT) family kinase protein
MLGRSQAELHNIVPAPLIETLRARGFQEGSFRFGGRLQWLSVKCEAYPWLAESVHWLLDNRPLEPEHLSICHCDFHPLNILVDGGKVSAVLDWSGFMIGDAAMDVAVTIVMCTIASDPLLGGYRSGEFIPKYLQAYRSVRPLDTAYLDYYRMFRCIMAYVHGAEGQVVWREPSALQALSAHVYEIAKIRVEVPDQTV